MIYILEGPIRTGKTTAVFDWVKDRNDVDGLLCPDDANGKRYFLKIKSKEKFKLEVETERTSEEVITVGNFQFLKAGFSEANNYLILASKTENRYLIIDELGKLELKNEGLHLAAEALISKYMTHDNQHLILVVRDYLLDAVLKHYAITRFSLLEKEDLKLLE